MVNDSVGHSLPSMLAVLLDHAFKRNGIGLKYFCSLNKMRRSASLIASGFICKSWSQPHAVNTSTKSSGARLSKTRNCPCIGSVQPHDDKSSAAALTSGDCFCEFKP